jgi:hypothetical protein
MGRTMQLLAIGVVGAMVLTAAFIPGRQTIGGIQALGNAGGNVISSAEGR